MNDIKHPTALGLQLYLKEVGGALHRKSDLLAGSDHLQRGDLEQVPGNHYHSSLTMLLSGTGVSVRYWGDGRKREAVPIWEVLLIELD